MQLGLFKGIVTLSLWIQFGYTHPRDPAMVTTFPPETRQGHYIPELHGADRGKYMRDDSGKYQHKDIPYDGGYGDRGLKYAHDVVNTLFHQMGTRTQPQSQTQPLQPPVLPLGPKDHLRFMIDFNYNSSGWQIIQFDWNRDGGEEQKYNFVNKNQLWHDVTNGDAYDASEVIMDQNEAGGYPDYAGYDEAQISDEVPFDEGIEEPITTLSDGPEEPWQHDVNQEEEQHAQNGVPTHSVHLDGEYKEDKFNVTYSHQDAQSVQIPPDIRNAIGEILKYIEKDVLPTLD